VSTCPSNFYRDFTTSTCESCSIDPDHEECKYSKSQRESESRQASTGAKFQPSSFILTEDDIYIWDINTRQLRVVDLTLHEDKYVEQYAGQYTVYGDNKKGKTLSSNEKYVWILGDSKVQQHGYYMQYVDYLQTLFEHDQCSPTQAISCNDFTATSCVGETNTYIMVWDNYEPAFGNMYA
jgi:hypothetical protein